MTRINLVKPQELHRLHLIAEIRELPRIVTYVENIASKGNKALMGLLQQVPKQYTLNKGHMKFFADKLEFIYWRQLWLVYEARARGYNISYDLKTLRKRIDNLPSILHNDYQPTEEAVALSWERINLRIKEKPHVYKV